MCKCNRTRRYLTCTQDVLESGFDREGFEALQREVTRGLQSFEHHQAATGNTAATKEATENTTGMERAIGQADDDGDGDGEVPGTVKTSGW